MMWTKPQNSQALVGQIGLTTRRNAVSWLIRIGQFINRDRNAEFSHAFIVTGPNEVVEAQIRGVRVDTLDKYNDTNTIFVGIALTDTQQDAIVKAARQLVGTPYSFLTYFYLLLWRIGIKPKGLGDYIASNKELICSATADLVYSRAGIKLFDDGRLPGNVTPADLAELILKRKWQSGFYRLDIKE